MTLRVLPAAFIANVAAAHVTSFTLAEFYFDSGTLYLTDCPFDVTYSSRSYITAYGVAAIGDITEVAGQARGLSFTLSGVNTGLLAAAFNEPMQGRSVVLRLATLSGSTLSVDDNVWKGTLDVPSVVQSASGETHITITAEHALSRWDKPNLVRHSHEDQQRFFPGDMFYSFASKLAEATVAWPSAAFFKK